MARKKLDFKPVNIDGAEYYTVRQFAELVHHTEGSIRQLLSTGNRIRKLKGIKMLGKTFIPIEELTEFLFTTVGRNYKTIYKFTKEGKCYELQI